MFPSAKLDVPTAEDIKLIELARRVIDANTDAGPDEDGAHTMGAAVRDAGGRDRQVLFDYYPGIRVLLPTTEGVRVATIEVLMPFAAAWSMEGGVQQFDDERFH